MFIGYFTERPYQDPNSGYFGATGKPVMDLAIHPREHDLVMGTHGLSGFQKFFLGSVTGLLGAGGQLLLFQALRQGPAYIVFPIISLYPVLTIALSIIILKERTELRQWIGIALALVAMFFLSNPQNNPFNTSGISWLILSILVFVMWAIQAYVMKFANNTMQAESIYTRILFHRENKKPQILDIETLKFIENFA